MKKLLSALLFITIITISISEAFINVSASTLVTKLYDFENMSNEDLKSIISNVPEEAVNIEKNAVITAEIYSAHEDDRYIGAGSKALRVYSDRGYDWPLAGFVLSIDGSKLIDAASIVLHLGATGSAGMFLQFVMSDGSIYTVRNGYWGTGSEWSGNMTKWNGSSWGTFDCGTTGGDTLQYCSPGTPGWIKIPLSANKMLKISGDAAAFDKTKITGLLIAGRANSLSDTNSIYVDEVYAVESDDNSVNFEESEPIEAIEAPEFEGYIIKTLYDFESLTNENAGNIISTDVPDGLENYVSENPNAKISASAYKSTGINDKYIGAGTRALKISANEGSWPPAGFEIALDGSELVGAEGVVFHLGLDTSVATKNIVMRFLYIMTDGSVYTVADGINGEGDSWDNNIAKYDGTKWNTFSCGNKNNAYLSYPETTSAWIKIPIEPNKMVKLCGASTSFEKKNVKGIFIAGNSDALSYTNSIFVDHINVLINLQYDLNGDNEVNAADLVALKAILFEAAESVIDKYDINSDGLTDIRDLIFLKKHLAE